MTDALVQGLFLVFQWPTPAYLVLGVLVGIVLGAVPGLGGILGLILLLPFTFGMDPVSAFALLLGMYAVTTTSDSISSILLGIPGTSSSQATILDGYPLAQKGHAQRAFGAAYTVSAFGGVFGAVLLAISLPLIVPALGAFRTPEMLVLTVLALSMVGMLSGRSRLKGLAVACLGLLLASIGYGQMVAIPRYTFDSSYLLGGLPLIPAVLGFFAIPEIIDLATRNTSISRIPKERAVGGGMIDGVRDALRHWWLAVRCAFMGTYIGVLPGLGGPIADWIAYGYAVRTARDKSQFGQGDIRGVIAPEAANNATKGGALIPTIAFGIPGSLGAAILLGALLIQGLRPGPDMLTTNLNLTFSMIWAIVIANVLAAALLMAMTQQVAKLAFVPGHLIVPGVTVFIFMGAWQGQSEMGDWLVCLGMGALGFAMKRGGWPRPPLILALILGGLLENFAVITLQAYPNYSWLTRPIVMVLIALLLASMIQAAFRRRSMRRRGEETARIDDSDGDPLVSALLSLGLFAMFVLAGLMAMDWPRGARILPVAVCTVGGLITALALVLDMRSILRLRAASVSVVGATLRDPLLLRGLGLLGLFVVTVLLALIVGQRLALIGFVVVYLRIWAGKGWLLTGAYAGGTWLVLTGFYDLILRTFWHRSLLESALVDGVGQRLPLWLFF